MNEINQTTSTTPKTLGEAILQGYTLGHTAKRLGYVSRKCIINDGTPVYVAGGSQKGTLYYKKPYYGSTRYYYRQYLVAPEK